MEKQQVKVLIEELFDEPYSLKQLYERFGDVKIGSCLFGLDVFKYREETDEEFAQRLLKEQKNKEEKDAQDRMTYLILKAKFEPNGH